MSDAIKSAGQSLINGSTGKNTDVPALVAALVNSRVAGLNAANTAKAKDQHPLTSRADSVSSASRQISLAPPAGRESSQRVCCFSSLSIASRCGLVAMTTTLSPARRPS
jgi:hypothetical protein